MYLNLAELEGLVARQPQSTNTPSNDTKNSSGGGGIKTSTVVFVVVAGVITLLLVGVVWVCFARKPRKSKIPGLPADKKKNNGFFGRITGRLRGGRYEQTAAEDTDQSHQLSAARNTRNNGGDQNTTQQNDTNTTTVDRHTSVRSIATLPAYRQNANQNEQVLGREGERDGIDMIVDLPTQEAEEELREQEMETLYQIRTTRRQLLAEREERREQRRDARRRGDRAALDDIRARTRAANEDTTISDLRQQVEQIKESRNRSVSTVSYADLGVARHDGTRIRANSTESERIGLLSDAASMELGHQRNNSTADSDMLSLAPTRTRGDSLSIASPYGGDPDGVSPRNSVIESDLGDTMPPPEYEDVSLNEENRSTTPMYEPPPDYPGPYRTASQRSQRSLTSTRHRDSSSSSEEHQNGVRQEDVTPETENGTQISPRGVGGVPQLPSLRIARLPEIAIDPPSAHPQDNTRHDNLS